MATIGVYDYDFMTYQHVIPNLECAKLYTYYWNQNQIATLAPAFEPSKYTKFIIRKDYDDGVFSPLLFKQNCEYGGRAFNPNLYQPLPEKAEKTIPDFSLYSKYVDHFGYTRADHALIKRILNCAHIRLSTDSIKPKSIESLQRILATGKYRGIIFHDYNLASVNNAYEIIEEISNTRHYIDSEKIRPYPIGNKFPIQVNSSEQLSKWLNINAMSLLFNFQYNGLMDDDILCNLCEHNKKIAVQMYYDISADMTDETDLIIRVLPKIFMQVLFLRRQNIRLLLKYDNEKIITTELRNFIDLLNCWLSFTWQPNFLPTAQSFYNFVRSDKQFHYTSWAFMNVTVTTDEARDLFQFFRERNYDLFKLFYEVDNVVYKGGKIVNEWS